MAKISLRSYTQDIERMVEKGRTEEAVAHCRYILQTYPKCVDIYRLLGKAYLESQRYGDAADIFQRVLSSIPEDFVSHVGMSLIREDEGNLDEAIWHMERAFEIQPANGAIQDELRRLYGKRDGSEPPKIRLTRGALARMYFKGALYQQAIAELGAVLTEDPGRLDLQALLASVYFQAGQQADAADKAGNILRKLPNCIEANLILAQVLSKTERDEEAKSYFQRLALLNPYYGYISDQSPSVEQTPEQAVMLEKITYKPGQASASAGGQPAWAASLGIDMGATGKSGEALPDWLVGVQESERSQPDSRSLPAFTEGEEEHPEGQQAGPLPDFLSDLAAEQPTQAKDKLQPTAEQIPEWMKTAGWSPSSGEGEIAEASYQVTDAVERTAAVEGSAQSPAGLPDNDEPVAQAEIPAWLRAMAPAQQDGKAEPGAAAEEDVSAWLDGLLGGPGISQPAAAPVESEASSGEVPSGLDVEAELPDWLKESEAAEEAAVEGELSDWLSVGEAPRGEAPMDQAPAEPQPLSEPAGADETQAAAEAAEGLPDWLLQGEPQPTVRTVQKPTPAPISKIPEAAPGAEIPDWMLEIDQHAPTVEALPVQPSPALPTDEIPDWLAGIGEEKTEATATPSIEIPDWLSGIPVETPTTAPEETAPVDELSSWLTSAAAETPNAEVEETAPAEEIPAWLLGKTGAAPAAEIIAEAAPAEELPAWLSETAAEAPSAEIEEAAPAEEIPTWLLETTGEAPIAETPAAEIIAEAAPAEELPSWLSEAAAEAPSAEIEEAAPAEEIPAWLSETTAEVEEAAPAEELPSWLSEAAAEAPSAEIEEAAPAEEVPTWLLETTSEAPIAETPAAEIIAETAPAEELPSWLSEAAAEAPSAEIEEAAPAEEIPAWLLETTGEAPIAETPAAEIIAEAAPAEELPSWLTEAAAEAPIAEIEEAALAEEVPAAPSAEMDDDAAFAWLESLAVKQGAEEALLLKPEERSETPPDWVLQETAQPEQPEPAAESPAAEVEEAIPAEELPAWLSEAAAEAPVAEIEGTVPAEEIPAWLLETTVEAPVAEAPISAIQETPVVEAAPAAPSAEMDADAAFAWLESLAVKQGAQEALLLKPEERSETPPDWVLQETAQPEQPEQTAEAPAAEVEEAIPAEEIPAWLSEAAAEAPVAEIEEAVPAEEIPAWLLESAAPLAAVDESLSAVEEEVTYGREHHPLETQPAEEIPAWLLGNIEPAVHAEEAPIAPSAAPEAESAAARLARLEGEEPIDLLADTRPTAVRRPPAPTQTELPVEKAAPPVEEKPAVAAPATPAAPTAEMDADAAFAWLESLAVKQGAEEALLLKPEERSETPPAWVLEETAQTTEPEAPAQPTEAEPAEAEPAAAPSTPSAEMDADAAFAWLEGLAVKQGAEEALLLKPEERSETPPAWVFAEQATPGAAPEARPVETPGAAVRESTVQETAPTAGAPTVSVESTVEEIPAALAAEPPVAIPAMPAEMVDLRRGGEQPGAAAAEEIPELPAWLSEAPSETEELEWTPPPVTAAAAVDLNTASLIELERLPGIGFIMAQNILDYRESKGPFRKLEDVLGVPGMSQATLNLVRGHVHIEEAPEPEPVMPAPLPVEKPIIRTVILSTDTEEIPADLSQAREALNEGKLDQALAIYGSLIRARQSLDEVIADLQAACAHYATVKNTARNITLWQHLGDAHLYANRPKEAMEAYITAEKLLR